MGHVVFLARTQLNLGEWGFGVGRDGGRELISSTQNKPQVGGAHSRGWGELSMNTGHSTAVSRHLTEGKITNS